MTYNCAKLMAKNLKSNYFILLLLVRQDCWSEGGLKEDIGKRRGGFCKHPLAKHDVGLFLRLKLSLDIFRQASRGNDGKRKVSREMCIASTPALKRK